MTLPRHVGVYGGGRMGSGIAHAFLTSGSRVTVIEANEAEVLAAQERVERSVAKAEAREVLREPKVDVLRRLVVTTETEELNDCSLVVEAVLEDVALKQGILSRIEQSAPHAVLATNTSSLSVDVLGSALARPENLIGLHFFNPVPASELIEVVVGSRTSDELRSLAQNWASDLGKTAITVTDSPGFASSRLGVALALEAMRMLESGVASAEDIDTAMTLGYKHPMGPLRTTDVVGLDVRLAIVRHLERELGDRFAPPQILLDKVSRGELGRKSGHGFFTW